VRLLAAVVVLVLAGAARAGLPAAPQRSGGVIGRPAKGKLLVASRQIGDPNFSRSVILLVAYEENGGAMGVIVNRPTPIPLAKVLPQFEALASHRDQVWLGGPVLPTSLMVLQKSPKPAGEAEAVFDDVYVLTSRDSVEGLFGSDKRPGRFRAYAGHTGWGPGQLENEIARGDWLVVSARPDVVFSEEPGGVWDRLMESSEGEWTLLEPPGGRASGYRASLG
jgi:putative transcriptional regulator